MIRVCIAFSLGLLLSACVSHTPVDGSGNYFIVTVPLPPHESSTVLASASRVYGSGDRWHIPMSVRKVMRLLAHDYDLDVLDTWPLQSIDEFCIVIDGRSANLTGLRGDSRVSSVVPVQRFVAMKSKPPYNDPHLTAQLGTHVASLNKMHAWSTGKGVSIGIIDTPVDRSHPDLRHRIASQEQFILGGPSDQDYVHGTAVAGVIGAEANNGIGIVGFAPDAEIHSFASCRYDAELDQSACNTFSLAKAVEAAATYRLDVLNLSIAGPEDRLLARLLEQMSRNGTIIVASDNPGDLRARFPASMKEVVAASAMEDRRSPPTTIRTEDEHLSTTTGGGYRFFYGTSMSAARVSALVALMLERAPGLSHDETRNRLSHIDDKCSLNPELGMCSMSFALFRSPLQVTAGGTP